MVISLVELEKDRLHKKYLKRRDTLPRINKMFTSKSKRSISFMWFVFGYNDGTDD